MSARRKLSTKDRVQVFTAANGMCHICGGRIWPGERWEAEHPIARYFSDNDALADLRPAHNKCHAVKTAETDIPAIAKSKRIEAKHSGAYRPARPMDGSRDSRFKKKMSGEVERRK